MLKVHGPYTPIRKAGDLYYLSGQIGVDPKTNQAQPTIEAQTKQILLNIQACLHSEGLSFESIVKTTIYLTDMNDFNVVNKVYEIFFSRQKPARACVGVADLPHIGETPLLIEIEAVAYMEPNL